MKVNKLKFLGTMIFITILMDVVSFIGFIRVGDIYITNLPIPAILTAIVLGPAYGVPIGAIFGIISLMRAVARETVILDILMQDPFITIIPRMCFPLIPGFVYKLLRKVFPPRWDLAAVAVSSVTGSVSNTAMILASLYLVYPNQLLDMLNIPDSQFVIGALIDKFGADVLAASTICAVACTLTVYGMKRYSGKKEQKIR